MTEMKFSSEVTSKFAFSATNKSGILAIWKTKEEDLIAIESTDMFYQFMSRMVNSNNEDFICEKDFFKTIYSITAFPMKNLFSLRKKHRSGTLVQKSVPNRNCFHFAELFLIRKKS